MMENLSNKLVYNWQEFWQYCEEIAQKIIDQDQSYSQIIAILRGGFYLGDYLSRKLNLPLSAITAQSYSADNQQQSLLVGNLSYIIKPTGKILLVDDLVDTGVTLSIIKQKLINDFQTEVDTAVVWRKFNSQFIPDYYYSITPSKTWIIQPFDSV